MNQWRPTRVAVIGGAGFLGSHLCERLLDEKVDVVCVDNLLTGLEANVSHLREMPQFSFIRHDITRALTIEGHLDAVLELASPASPRDYLKFPIDTLMAGSLGTRNALDLAHHKGARFLITSTSEVYGDPLVHPQSETYWGNVNPIGPRSVYDEAKRFSEALVMAYHREYGLETRIARIFNTMGPRMKPSDGRIISNFIMQALRGEPFTIYGDGLQTRSICYVSDQVEGLWRLLCSDYPEPINIGNPEEHTVLDVAQLIAEILGVAPEFAFEDRPVDDPQTRCPDITRARQILNWEPTVSLRSAVMRTVGWYQQQLQADAVR